MNFAGQRSRWGKSGRDEIPVAANQKLIRQLRRELTANPKKSAILCLLLLVAVWFWAPLIMKWFGNNQETIAKTAPAVNAPSNAGPNDSQTANSNGNEAGGNASGDDAKTATPHWHQVLTWIQSDPLMHTHLPQGEQRDPFAPAKSRLAAQKLSQHSAEPPPQELTPAQAGIALRSTVVSSRMKTALINGRAYHENQTVSAPNGQDHFTLVEIRVDGIVLARHGQSFELKLKTVEFANANE